MARASCSPDQTFALVVQRLFQASFGRSSWPSFHAISNDVSPEARKADSGYSIAGTRLGCERVERFTIP